MKNNKEDFHEAISWEDEHNAFFQYAKASGKFAFV